MNEMNKTDSLNPSILVNPRRHTKSTVCWLAELKANVFCLSIDLAPGLIHKDKLQIRYVLVTLYVHPLFFLRFYLSFLKFSWVYMNMDNIQFAYLTTK